LEQTSVLEISILPETRLSDMLAFVRYLKLSIPKIEKKNQKGVSTKPLNPPAPTSWQNLNLFEQDHAPSFFPRGKP